MARCPEGSKSHPGARYSPATRGSGQPVCLGELGAPPDGAGEGWIEYRHRKELAPTTELRELQYREDDRLGVRRRSRVELAAEYRQRYFSEILSRVALRPIVESMPVDGAAALLCVEADPEACHRSLVAERLQAEFGLPVEHLRPPPD